MWDRPVDIGIGLGELRISKPARPRDVLRAGARDDGQALNVVAMRPAARFTSAGEGAYMVAPRMPTRVAERGSAATRASPALMGRAMLLERPELAADPALGFHAKEIG